MTNDGEWVQKGATLSDVTAKEEYGVSSAFIRAGMNAGKLQFREGSNFGNPYWRLLRRELEALIAAEFGVAHLERVKAQAELQDVKQQLSSLKRQMSKLESRRKALEEKLKSATG